MSALWILLNRWHVFQQPASLDLTTYAVIGHGILGEARLYTDFWDHKPPLIYLTYAFSEWLVGFGQQQFFFLGILAAWITLAGVFIAGKWGTGSSKAGLWAALFWALLGSDLRLEAQMPNTEVFQNIFAIWGFSFYIRWTQRKTFQLILSAGLCFAFASLYKQPMIVLPACLLIADFLRKRGDEAERRRVFRGSLTLFGIGLLAWAVSAGYFIFRSRGADFYGAVFQFNQDYIAYNPHHAGGWMLNILHASWPPSVRQALPPGALWPFVPLIGLCAWGATRLRRNLASEIPWSLLIAYGAATHLAVALPGRLYAHYYQLWLVPLAVACGWILYSWDTASAPSKKWHPLTAGIAALGVLAFYEAPLLALAPEACSDLIWKGRFTADRQLGEAVQHWLAPGETVYQWGHETSIYFYSRRRPASGILDTSPLAVGRFQASMLARVLNDLKTQKPELVIVPQMFIEDVNPDHPVMGWVFSQYVPFPRHEHPGSYYLFIRSGGALQARLSGADNETVKMQHP